MFEYYDVYRADRSVDLYKVILKWSDWQLKVSKDNFKSN